MPRPRVPASARALPLLILAAACAGSGTTAATPGTVSVITGDGAPMEIRRNADVLADQGVAATPDQAWQVLPDVYAAMGLTPDVQDSRARILSVSAHRFSRTILGRAASDFFDCGTDPGLNRPIADQVPVTAQVSTTVMAVGDGAALRTVAQGTARRTGGNAGIATCRSTGLLEAMVGQMVRERTGGE